MTSKSTIAQRAAEETGARVTRALRGLPGCRQAVILKSPAGGGKSTFIAATTAELARKNSVVVAASTNEQVYSLVYSISKALARGNLHYVPARGKELPRDVPANVVVCDSPLEAADAQIVVGTLNKIGDALGREHLEPRDYLIVDEAYQADSGKYYLAAPAADAHLLVGDQGQIDPFTTTTEALRYRGLTEDPVRTAVDVLLEANPDTDVFRLPITWRIDGRSLPLARAFYEVAHVFDAAVPVGVRALELGSVRYRDVTKRALLEALTAAGQTGLCHIELPEAPTMPTDPEIVSAIADLVEIAIDPRTKASVTCEKHKRGRVLSVADIAVGTSHTEQVRALRREFRKRRIDGIKVDTANKLQGLEFELVIAWHPLAGLTDADAFHLESGRLCVLTTRHRQACLVIGRASDRALIDGIPPSGDAWLGRDDEPLLEGWNTHAAVFEALAPYRVALAPR